jgi:PAS domain S-box-containing protein
VRLAGVPAEVGEGYMEDHPFGGRVWRIETHMPPGYLAQRTTWRPWGALALGLVATALLVTAIYFATSRARIRLLVERRSKEVEAAYDTLAHEAQQRLWAMAEMRQVQLRMRQIIDLVPNWIYVKDRFGCFLLANEATAEAYGTTVARLTAPSRIDFNAAPQSDEILRAERALVEEQRSEITPVQPFRDAEGRVRLLRTIKIPCVFEDETKALLCVATDVTDQEHATRLLRSQNRILAELASGQDPDTVLEELVHEAEELVPGMRCSVLLRSADGQHLEHGFGPSLPDFYKAAIEGLEIGASVGSCGAAAHSGERVIVEDVNTHPNWAAFRELTRRAGIGACWSQPIRSTEGEILGTFAMYYATVRGPAEFEIRIIETWAHLAGIAIERRRQVTG